MNADTEIQPIPKLLTDESSKYKGPGWQLRTAREAAQIGIGDVARQLRLSVDMIASIERDDYSHMAGLTFIRGYLRSYSRLLNLSPDEILIAFDRLGIPEKVPQIPLNIYGAKQTVLNESAIRSIGYAVFAGIVILVAVWWHSQGSNPAPVPAVKNAPTATTNTAAPVAAQTQTNVPNGQVNPATSSNSTKTQDPIKMPPEPQNQATAATDVQPKVEGNTENTDEVARPKSKAHAKSRRKSSIDEEVDSSTTKNKISEPSTEND
ncbi:hypothetical protein BH10PSE19_BH10PSE19_04170 [soil metagenome]